MSYDYLLVKGQLGAGASLEAFAEGATAQSIGPVEDVKRQISALFPSVKWKHASVPGLDAVFGSEGPAEFQFMIGGGEVVMITMSRAERREVALVAKTLGLVALDEQSMDLFDG